MILRLSGVAPFPVQFEACQPAGNGISGQTGQLSLAAFARQSGIGFAWGVGGGDVIARRK